MELCDYDREMPSILDPRWTRPQKHQFYLERFCERLIRATADTPSVMFEIFNEGEWYEAQPFAPPLHEDVVLHLRGQRTVP